VELETGGLTMSRRNKNTPKGGQSNISVMDAFSNPLYRLGYGSQSPLEATEYPLTRMTDNYALLNSLYRDNWVVQNVVGLMVDDMLREWYKVRGTISPDYLDELERVERVTQLRDRINQGLCWGRLYGGAAGLILIKGQEGMLDQPLDLETIMPGTFAGLLILDRWSGIVPDMGLVTDMSDPDFNLPEYYTINNAEGRMVARVHHSRIVRFTGRKLPYLEEIAELYWGESEVEALYKDVVAHDNVSANMAALTFRANINTMEVQNLEQLFSLGSAEQQKRFWNVMQAQSVMMSNFGFQLVNKGDQMKNTQYTFTGLQEVYESMCLNLCGASHYPMTKLFGRSPSGMNATGESDLQNYYDYVNSQREAKLRPVLERLLPIMAVSVWGAIPDNLQIDFPPLWTPTAKEVAEIAKAKAEAIVSTYQAGLLHVDTAQKELKKLEDDTGMWGSITDEEIKANAGKTFQDATALRDPLAGIGFEEELSNAEPTESAGA
jgi:phage-associated protein, HI1409 family